MPDRTDNRPAREAARHQGGYEGAGPEYGRGYGRDFGGGGRNQGFDGSWGQGYGGSMAPSDYREGFGDLAYGAGMRASDYERSIGGRGEDFGADDRSWMDRCADDECAGLRRHHAGRGPKGWNRDDQALYAAVCERLTHDRLIDARGVEVEVENGVVTVRGQAAAPADAALIERLVRETAGVKGLELHLAMRPRGEAAARALAPDEDDRVDKSSLSAPILARRAPPPDPAGAP
ncbi:MAG TPA: BON domain-containing protein [Phenylobacterium sp.]|jgi:hypothetical protein|nr:BON domain-containing protein [Phenylobacterium sp.]